jgi:hypothetical protein
LTVAAIKVLTSEAFDMSASTRSIFASVALRLSRRAVAGPALPT